MSPSESAERAAFDALASLEVHHLVRMVIEARESILRLEKLEDDASKAQARLERENDTAKELLFIELYDAPNIGRNDLLSLANAARLRLEKARRERMPF